MSRIINTIITVCVPFLTISSAFSWNYNFASCSNGKSEGNCTCPVGKVMARQFNRLVCFDRCDGCPNGFCGLFGTCNCFAGHDAGGSCLKICSNCNNGWCSSSEKCECNHGFVMSKDNTCMPSCDPLCSKHGYCSAPGVCSCRKGYQKSKMNKCLPVCSHGCPTNSYCYAPQKCKCNKRYRRHSINFRIYPNSRRYGHRFKSYSRYNKFRCVKNFF